MAATTWPDKRRPCLTYPKVVAYEFRIIVSELENAMQDRYQWKCMVNSFCSPGNYVMMMIIIIIIAVYKELIVCASCYFIGNLSYMSVIFLTCL